MFWPIEYIHLYLSLPGISRNLPYGYGTIRYMFSRFPCGLFDPSIGALMWALVGFHWCCTIVGIPFGVQCFKAAFLVMWPFGKEVFTSIRFRDKIDCKASVRLWKTIC